MLHQSLYEAETVLVPPQYYFVKSKGGKKGSILAIFEERTF